MQGKQAAKNMTRGGGADNTRQAGGRQCKVMGQQRTQCEAIRWLATEQEEEGEYHDVRQ
jgi:hypothetical protein